MRCRFSLSDAQPGSEIDNVRIAIFISCSCRPEERDPIFYCFVPSPYPITLEHHLDHGRRYPPVCLRLWTRLDALGSRHVRLATWVTARLVATGPGTA